MLYTLLKLPARLALYFYCRKIIINKKEFLKSDGPLLIAANHPSSFLDAVILATLFKDPIYSLARGDAFINNFYKKLLYSLKMLPVYRISEGAENLEHNYTTFSACLDIFKKNGIVLIFSEGRCINEWHLRPLKKGTARLAISAWQQGIPLKVIPLGINYSSFRLFGKNVILNVGELIEKESFNEAMQAGEAIIAFNTKLQSQLQTLVVEADPSEKEKIKKIFLVQHPLIKKIFLFIPAVAGWLLHAPLYYLVILLIKHRAEDHYDSVVVGLLFILYPVYLLAITIIAYFITGTMLAYLLLLILPFTAWSCLQLKRQLG
ncbi:MAG TPA: 1-acyl-sn-glycerol-3-phosphate acyltransferase [Chitinophagaceae bacterium]|nr:1-acyl-sn-glycerol-3-phosphate acyltransferase [Chitinophagaceae bacterium]